MKKVMSNALFLLLTVLCVFFVVQPKSADGASIWHENEDVIFRPSNNIAPDFKLSNASLGEINNTNSYASPHVFSSKADTIPYIHFYLNDENYDSVTGIVVDKIEMFQSGNLILSTTNVTSYSHHGEYVLRNITLKSQFSNSNGNNEIDVVFYKCGTEVARLTDFTIQCFPNTIVSTVYPNEVGADRSEFPLKAIILNANENATVDAYLTDNNGEKVATSVGEDKESRTYNNDSKALNVGLKMIKGSLFENSNSNDYNVHIMVNNIEMSYTETYYNQVHVDDKPGVRIIYLMEKSPYRYHIWGINLINASPFTLELKQKGEIIAEITGINAKFDPKTYCEYIDEDITSKIKDLNTEMQATLYSKGVEVDSFTYLLQPDAPVVNNIAKDITAFTAPKQVGNSTIDSINHTVTFHMVNGTNVNKITPTITVSAGATINPKSKASKNFTDPVIYTITAKDGTSQTWTVTCVVDPKSSSKDITSFTVPKQVGVSIIDSTNHTINFHMANGTKLKSIKPTIVVSGGATISPKSKAAKNFTDPVIYTVMAQDGTSQTWTVNCVIDPKS